MRVERAKKGKGRPSELAKAQGPSTTRRVSAAETGKVPVRRKGCAEKHEPRVFWQKRTPPSDLRCIRPCQYFPVAFSAALCVTVEDSRSFRAELTWRKKANLVVWEEQSCGCGGSEGGANSVLVFRVLGHV